MFAPKSAFFILFIYALGFKSGAEFFGSLTRIVAWAQRMAMQGGNGLRIGELEARRPARPRRGC